MENHSHAFGWKGLHERLTKAPRRSTSVNQRLCHPFRKIELRFDARGGPVIWSAFNSRPKATPFLSNPLPSLIAGCLGRVYISFRLAVLRARVRKDVNEGENVTSERDVRTTASMSFKSIHSISFYLKNVSFRFIRVL